MQDLFERLNASLLSRSIQEFHVEMSFIQIYMEEVSDLLNPDSGALAIRQSAAQVVQGMVEVEIFNAEEGY